MRRAMLKTDFSSIDSAGMVMTRSKTQCAIERADPLTIFSEFPAERLSRPVVGVRDLQPQPTFRVRPVIFSRGQRNAEGLGGLRHG